MIVLDTTVLLYAQGDQHQLRGPCRGLVEAIANDRIRATTTAAVIQEFVHVRARRRSRTDAARLGKDYVSLLAPLATTSRGSLLSALDLWEQNDRVDAFDAVLAATTVQIGAQALVTADRALGALAEVQVVFPDGDGLAQLLHGLG